MTDILDNPEGASLALWRLSTERGQPEDFPTQYASEKPQVVICCVPGCDDPLESAYDKKSRICGKHRGALEVIISQVPHRFCQKCSKFHLTEQFDGERKNCRQSLRTHNIRQRRRRFLRKATEMEEMKPRKRKVSTPIKQKIDVMQATRSQNAPRTPPSEPPTHSAPSSSYPEAAPQPATPEQSWLQGAPETELLGALEMLVSELASRGAPPAVVEKRPMLTSFAPPTIAATPAPSFFYNPSANIAAAANGLAMLQEIINLTAPMGAALPAVAQLLSQPAAIPQQ